MHRIGIIALVTALVSCNRAPVSENLYPIDSILTQQINYFTKEGAVLIKSAALREESDQKTVAPHDSAAWASELEILAQLSEINRPGNRSNYLVNDHLYDPGSNLAVKSLTAIHDEPVQSMKIFFHDAETVPRKIEAVYAESNLLYSSKRNLLLEFQQFDNKNVLTSYSIDGVQKMVMSDSVRFSISAKIKLETK